MVGGWFMGSECSFDNTYGLFIYDILVLSFWRLELSIHTFSLVCNGYPDDFYNKVLE